VHERVSTKSFVVLIIGNSKSFHLGAQGTFNLTLSPEPDRVTITAASGVLVLPPVLSLGLFLLAADLRRQPTLTSLGLAES